MAQQQKLIIHGGAGSLEGNIEREEAIRQSLQSICEKTYAFLLRSSANEAVIYGIKLLEALVMMLPILLYRQMIMDMHLQDILNYLLSKVEMEY